MCNSASMIITEDKVLIGIGTNRHSTILKQHNIKGECDTPSFVKVEITPPYRDFSQPFSTWTYAVDQDVLPDWYVNEVDEQRARAMLPQWYHEHVELQNTDAMNLTQNAGDRSTQMAGDRSTQMAGDESTQTAGFRSTQTAGFGSTQTAGDESVQKAGSGSTQKAGFGSTQMAGFRSTQTAGACSTQMAGDESTQKASIGTVQIIRDVVQGKIKTKTRVITEAEAGKPYKFYDGEWHLIKE